VSRLLCLVRGHWWSEWGEVVFAHWTTNGEPPKMRYCYFCGKAEHDALGRLILRLEMAAD